MDKNQPVLLHNPRCSKSRETLALLREIGHEPDVREYLKAPLSAIELAALIAQLDTPATSLVRTKEAKQEGLEVPVEDLSDDGIVNWLATHPKSMQRPVVIFGGAAKIGRPPEAVRLMFQHD